MHLYFNNDTEIYPEASAMKMVEATILRAKVLALYQERQSVPIVKIKEKADFSLCNYKLSLALSIIYTHFVCCSCSQ
jgi:hypothetical protein